MELPPRARRIPTPAIPRLFNLGTTSACAENTMSLVNPIEMLRNYLRVRGEYERSRDTEILSPELPPRARRIRSQGPTHTGSDGTTSACAENTKPPPPLDKPTGNYLRVRGEYYAKTCTFTKPVELPPRARRIHRHTLV